MRQLDALALLERDRRAPVLYLRSFDDDDLPDLALTNSTLYPESLFPQTYEMKICRVMNTLGPVISIGRPGEQVPELGASRLYVSDREWQIAIEYFFQRAGAVVINVGRSEGVLWEAINALREVNPARLLFFFPYVLEKGKRYSWLQYRKTIKGYGFSLAVFRRMENERQQRYQVFRERIQKVLPYTLPLSLGEANFLSFTESGEPYFLATRRSILASIWAGEGSKTQIVFKETLKPFLAMHLNGRVT